MERAEIIANDVLYTGFNTLRELTFRVRRQTGEWARTSKREVLVRHDAACLLPYDPVKDNVVFVRQFRAGAFVAGDDPYQIEPPAGLLTAEDDPVECAIREAREEAGVQVTEVVPVCRYLATPGVSGEAAHVFCGRVESPESGLEFGVAEEGEVTEVVVLPVDEALELLAAGKVSYVLTILSLHWLAANRARLREAWAPDAPPSTD